MRITATEVQPGDVPASFMVGGLVARLQGNKAIIPLAAVRAAYAHRGHMRYLFRKVGTCGSWLGNEWLAMGWAHHAAEGCAVPWQRVAEAWQGPQPATSPACKHTSDAPTVPVGPSVQVTADFLSRHGVRDNAVEADAGYWSLEEFGLDLLIDKRGRDFAE